MTSTKSVNVDVCIEKLEYEVKYANSRGFVTVKARLLEMAINALEQQQARLAVLQTEHIGLAVSEKL
jgi:hypothetical protein